MLAAIIANLQNQPQPQPQPLLPMVHIDRGGGGQSWPRYDIVDIIAAAAAFPEISGESSVARAARRHRWIGEALPFVKETREKREAAAFLAGAQLADAVAEERHAAQDQLKSAQIAELEKAVKLSEKLSIEQMIKIVDEVRDLGVRAAPQDRAPTAVRGAHGTGAILALGLLLGVTLGVAITRRRQATLPYGT